MSDPTPARAGEDAGREEHPTNDTLQRIGAFARSCKIGKHQATNWVHLRATIAAIDAAGLREAADTLIWQVWHQVNSAARHDEFYRIGLDEKIAAEARASAAEAEVAWLTQERDAAAAGSREMNRLRAQSGAEASALRERVARLEEALALLLPFVDHSAGQGLAFFLGSNEPDMDAADLCMAAAKSLGIECGGDEYDEILAAGKSARAALTEGAPTDV